MARDMLGEGFSDGVIKKLTGLSDQDISKLIKAH